MSGRVCGSYFGLEYDHYKVPFAKGGDSTADALTLRCKQHNALGAVLEFGLGHMQKHWIVARASPLFNSLQLVAN